MRISDWSSDVCSSDLASVRRFVRFQDDGSVRDIAEVGRGSLGLSAAGTDAVGDDPGMAASWQIDISACNPLIEIISRDRKSVVEGKSVSVRVDIGGRRIIKKKTQNNIRRENKKNKP